MQRKVKELILESKKYITQTIKCFTVDFIVFKLCGEAKKQTTMLNHSQLNVDGAVCCIDQTNQHKALTDGSVFYFLWCKL